MLLIWQYLTNAFLSITKVPNLSLTMYTFSILTDENVPLQHFNRLAYVPTQILFRRPHVRSLKQFFTVVIPLNKLLVTD